MADHQPLHNIHEPGDVRTGGRLTRAGDDDSWKLRNIRGALPLHWDHAEPDLERGALARVEGYWNGSAIEVETLEIVGRSGGRPSVRRRGGAPDLSDVSDARDRLNRMIRRYFRDRDFREVETPCAVPAPGTDIYLEPIGTRSLEDREPRTVEPFLQTSPEFAMKRLLTEGFERIFQLAKVWRDGEVTDLHHPEFTLLEWYRAWEPLESAIRDAEQLVTAACDGEATAAIRTPEGVDRRAIPLDPPFERLTMRKLVEEAAGFDILEALEYESLRRAIVDRDLLQGDLDRRHPPDGGRWDDLFFELMIARIEPHLATKGAVVVTEWPAPLAILARRSEKDPRVAHRFEVYVGGIELANGFDELRDPDIQRRRFEEELDDRASMDRPTLPMPEAFLEALEYGLPPSAGVALGVDRLLMLAVGAPRIDDVAPFAHRPGLRDV